MAKAGLDEEGEDPQGKKNIKKEGKSNTKSNLLKVVEVDRCANFKSLSAISVRAPKSNTDTGCTVHFCSRWFIYYTQHHNKGPNKRGTSSNAGRT